MEAVISIVMMLLWVLLYCASTRTWVFNLQDQEDIDLFFYHTQRDPVKVLGILYKAHPNSQCPILYKNNKQNAFKMHKWTQHTIKPMALLWLS